MELTFLQILVARIKSTTPAWYKKLRLIAGILTFIAGLVLTVYKLYPDAAHAAAICGACQSLGIALGTVFAFTWTGTADPALLDVNGGGKYVAATEATTEELPAPFWAKSIAQKAINESFLTPINNSDMRKMWQHAKGFIEDLKADWKNVVTKADKLALLAVAETIANATGIGALVDGFLDGLKAEVAAMPEPGTA